MVASKAPLSETQTSQNNEPSGSKKIKIKKKGWDSLKQLNGLPISQGQMHGIN
jgi:hypothetical protein